LGSQGMTETNKPAPDWEKIEADIRAGILSNREISRQHNVSESAIRKRIKTRELKRDLSARIKEQVRIKMVRSEVRTPNATDSQVVDEKSDQVVEALKLQREDIAKLREEEQRLLKELGDNPTKLWVGQYQGQVIEHEVGIAVTERAAALQALANVQHKRIQLERQALGMSDKDGAPGDDIEEIRVTFVRSSSSE